MEGMQKNSFKTLLLISFLVALFVLPFNFAEELVEYAHGTKAVAQFYAASGPATYNVCAYASYMDSLTIRNQGNLPDTYDIKVISDNPIITDWIMVSQPTLTLEEGEEATVVIYTKTPAGVEGSFSYSIEIASTYDSLKTIEKNVAVQECTNIQLATRYTSQETCPCSTAVYVFDLENSGAFDEQYILWLEGVDSEVYELSEYYVALAAGEHKTIYGYVRLPCFMYGNFDFELQAESTNTKYEAMLPLSLNIEQACYNYNIALGEALVFSAEDTLAVTFTPAETTDYVLCEEDPAIIPIYMQNPSSIINDYHISIQDGVSWITSAEPYIRLKGMQEHTTSLIVNTATAEPGLYSFALKIDTSRGDLETAVPFTVEIQDCDGSRKKDSWLYWILWGLLGAIIMVIIVVGVILFLRRRAKDNEKKANKKGTKEAKRIVAFRSWLSKYKWWLIPISALLLLALLIGTIAWPVVKGNYHAGEVMTTETQTIPTLLYNWATGLVLLLLLLLLAFIAWWFRLCDKAKRKHIISRMKSTMKNVWQWIKPLLKWIWIVALLLLLLSGLVAGLYFFYTHYKDDAGKLFAVDENLTALEDDDLTALQSQIQAKEDEITKLEEQLLEHIETATQTEDTAVFEQQEMDIAALQEQIVMYEEELAGLREQRDAILDSINNLETNVAVLEGHISNLEDRITALDEEIAALHKLITELSVTTVEDSTGNDLIEELRGEISDLEGRVSNLKDEKDKLEAIVKDIELVIHEVDKEAIPEIKSDSFETILIFDVSLSGQIVENGQSRFDQGIEEAKKFIQDKGQYTIMVIGKNPVIVRRDAQADIALRVLQNLRPLDTQSNLGKALMKAADDFGSGNGRIVLVSDLITTDGTDIYKIANWIQQQGIEVIFLDVSRSSETNNENEAIVPTNILEEETTKEETTKEEIIQKEKTGEEEAEAIGPIFDVESQTTENFVIEMQKNTQYHIALDSYFADPDDDSLTYSIDVGGHLTAVLDESIVTLIPEKDWVGESDFVVTANDGKGGIVSSPLILVDVADTPKINYIPYLIIGSIIFLIIISLIIGAFTKKYTSLPPKEE